MSSLAQSISEFSTKEVKTFFSQARRLLRHPGLTILVCPATKSFGRILVITSRKSGNSPERNKIRRRLKAIFYEEKLFDRGYDYVVIIRNEAMKLSFNDLKTIILKPIIPNNLPAHHGRPS